MNRVLRTIAPFCLLLLATGCDRDELDYAVGTIERYRINLAADSAEPVIRLHVREGDAVDSGMLLIEQDSAKLQIALSRAEAEEALALARLREAEAGPRAQEIDRARAQLASMRSALATAEHELERQQSLITQSYASQSTVNILQGQVDVAGAQVREADALLAELLEGTRSEQVDQARAAHAASQSRTRDLQVDLDRTQVRAPLAGVVEVVPFRPGERPQKGQTIMVLLSSAQTFARVHIPEPLRTRLNPGDAARFRIDGHPSDYSGRIRWISSTAAFTPYYALTQHDRSRLAYLAEIDLMDDVDLPNGVPVEVRFPSLTPDR